VVGATRLEDDSDAEYSSLGELGKDRRGVRDLVARAPADESASAIGLYAAGAASDTLVRMGGTSVAAPIVARYLVRHFLANTAEEVRASEVLATFRPITSMSGAQQAPLIKPNMD
jgi:hypothetical protein